MQFSTRTTFYKTRRIMMCFVIYNVAQDYMCVCINIVTRKYVCVCVSNENRRPHTFYVTASTSLPSSFELLHYEREKDKIFVITLNSALKYICIRDIISQSILIH